jgi:hypothetical protein
LQAAGIIVKSDEELMINGYRGRLVFGEQKQKMLFYYNYLLLFGDEDNTFLIFCFLKEDFDKDFRDAIRTSLLSVVYEPYREIDSRKTTFFEIDESSCDLQFAGVVSGSSVYTIDGLIPTKSYNKTSLTTAQFINEEGMEDKKLFATDLIKQTENIQNIEIQFTRDIILDGLSGYEITAFAEDDITKEFVFAYQMVLFSDDYYYVLKGLVYDDVKTNLDMVEAVCKTFKRW